MKKMIFRYAFPIYVAAGLLSASPAFSAAGADERLISTAGGIAAPSATSAIAENPAGLIYNQQFTLLGELANSGNSSDSLGVGGLAFLGNGSVGLGAGLRTFSVAGSGSITFLDVGLATVVPMWNVALGVSASDALQDSGGGMLGKKPFDMNLGALFNPTGALRFGAAIAGLLDGVDVLAGGLALDVNSFATLAVDAAMTPGGHGKILKPGISIRVDRAQLAMGYGILTDSSDPNPWLPKEFSLGAGWNLNPNVHLQFYYQQLSKYYGGISFKL